MSDACTQGITTDGHYEERCGCGAGLSAAAINVIHAETGRLLTRFCHRCAGDLLSPERPPTEAASVIDKAEVH